MLLLKSLFYQDVKPIVLSGPCQAHCSIMMLLNYVANLVVLSNIPNPIVLSAYCSIRTLLSYDVTILLFYQDLAKLIVLLSMDNPIILS